MVLFTSYSYEEISLSESQRGYAARFRDFIGHTFPQLEALVHPRVLDYAAQRVAGYMTAVDCVTTSVELGLVVVVDMVGVRRGAKLGNVGPRIFVREVFVQIRAVTILIAVYRAIPVALVTKSVSFSLRQVSWTIGVAAVFLGAVLVYS